MRKLSKKSQSSKSSAEPPPARKPGLLVRRTQDGHVYVMTPEVSDHYFAIQGVAAELWADFDGKTTVAEHVKKLAQAYPRMPRARLEQDVSLFLKELRGEGLI